MTAKRKPADTAAELEASASKSERMAGEVAERAGTVPVFDHLAYHPDRYSSKGARKASGHGAGARRRRTAASEAADA